MATADLIIRVITDTSRAKGLDETAGKFGKFGAGIKKMTVPAAAALAGIVAFGAGSVKAASDVQQSLGAVDAVFGKNSSTIKKWADQSASAVGISKNSYMELASVTGAQLKNMGLPMDKVTGKTGDLIKKGADLAAQFGGTTKEAVEAIGSALRGETDPIERYGVSIKQADIAAQQAAEGTSKLTGKAGKQAKTMALLHLLNKQTADSTGAFARENDSAAHQAQVAQAQYEDMQATLGEALLPAITKVMAVLASLAKLLAKHKTTTQVAIAAIAAMAIAVLALNVAMTVYTAVTTLAGSATVVAWVAALWPILAVIAAVLLVVGAVVLLWKKSKTFRTIVLAVWSAIKNAARATGHFIVSMWNQVSAGAKQMASVVRSVWAAISSAARSVGNAVRNVWNAVWGAIRNAASATGRFVAGIWHQITAGARAMGAVVRSIWGTIRTVAGNVGAAVRAVWHGVWTAVSAYVRAYLAVIRAVFTAIRTVAGAVAGWVGDRWHSLWANLREAAANFRDSVRAIFYGIRDTAAAVAGAIADRWRGMMGGLRAAAGGLGSALSRPFQIVRGAIDSLIGAIQSLIGWLSRIHVPKISLPHIPGFNATAAAAPGVATTAAVGRSAAPALTSPRARSATPGAGGISITVNGAVDPEATARQIQRILSGHNRRVGLTVAG